MTHELPPLPYAMDALAPHISEETLQYHYGKHHKGYVDKLNKAIAGTEFEGMSLEDTIRKGKGGVFNNAAQIWNHTFYWNSMSPNGGGKPAGRLAEAIDKSFGSFEDFKKEFAGQGGTLFGSGWVWLTKKNDGSLVIEQGFNADNPLKMGGTALLTCDVWEHAYYIDYRNAKPKYIDAFWELVNWDFVSRNFGG